MQQKGSVLIVILILLLVFMLFSLGLIENLYQQQLINQNFAANISAKFSS